MSNPTETGVCDNAVSCKKGVFDQYLVCRYCDKPPYFQSKINQKHFGIHIKSEIEQKKRKKNRKQILRGRDRMSLEDDFDLCDDGNVLSNKDKLLKIGKLLGVEAKNCNEIPNKGWKMADRKMKGRKLMI